jgi:hypothetical protein
MSANPTVFKEIDALDGEKIVLLDWEGQSPQFINMQKVDSGGNILWTAKPRHPLEGVWTGARFENGMLTAYNYAGFLDTIDYQSGHILHSVFVK